MVNPNSIVDYNRTDEELEELILFLVCVAGKKASTVVRLLGEFLFNSTSPYLGDRVLAGRKNSYPPFAWIRRLDELTSLRYRLQECKFGQYNKIERAFRELANSNLNLRTCTKDDLMEIHGIGRKSASCFLAWTRRGEDVAMLDTHLLKFLAHVKRTLSHTLEHVRMIEPLQEVLNLLNTVEIPKSTPSSKKIYDTLENAWLKYCKFHCMKPVEFDLEIWRYYSRGLDKGQEPATIGVR